VEPVLRGDAEDPAPHPAPVDAEDVDEQVGEVREQAVTLLDGTTLQDDRGEYGAGAPPLTPPTVQCSGRCSTRYARIRSTEDHRTVAYAALIRASSVACWSGEW
jgi:hypothetical protein